MQALSPVTRDFMQKRKAQKDEEKRIAQVDQIVKSIYYAALNTSESSDNTSYKYPLQCQSNYQYDNVTNTVSKNAIPNTRVNQMYDSTYANLPDIMSKLQGLFPDCTVRFTTLSMGLDGKMYDMSMIDDKMRPFINTKNSQDHIVIDWS